MHGCMGAVTKGTQSMNGDVIGVIHEKWCVDGDEDRSIQNMIIVGMWSAVFSCSLSLSILLVPIYLLLTIAITTV